MQIMYDYPALRSQTLVLEGALRTNRSRGFDANRIRLTRPLRPAGLEVNKTFLRRWDTQDEYMYRVEGDFPVCRRGFLSEPMPGPELASGAAREATRQPGTETINGRTAIRWTREDYPSRQQVYVDAATGVPFALVDEFFEELGAADPPAMEYPGQDPAGVPVPEPPSATAGTWAPVMTYVFETLAVGPPATWPLSAEQRSRLWAVPPPWREDNRTLCVRHQGGWPYLHAFHHFLRV